MKEERLVANVKLKKIEKKEMRGREKKGVRIKLRRYERLYKNENGENWKEIGR